ncbi:MAG: 1-acyl-sn-glycerol-3-phosphate acyltransferase [Leptospiraceae bacterium]|nr:1-acyl-sn-glycerol-3-phosphate acyltransferase [Leptospiraceae bacterium]MCP5499243.1 1-acyl-sn-glycerol-3-phosphate acyltransferase [Leptospiraceae bacterium]
MDEIPSFLKDNQKIYEEYFDKDFTKSLIENVVAPLNDYYFRTRMIGFDTLPERNNPDRPLIFISNHSGMAFPWDAMVFVGSYYLKCGFSFKNNMRALAAPMLSASNLMCPYMIPNFWKRVGGIDATLENFETMMHQKDSNILIYPEGVPGIGKGFNRRYQLQKFSTSFLRMSIKYKTDIIVVSTVNAEYINPYSYNNHTINKLVQKMGLPFLPLGLLTLFIPLQPWFFYIGLPANLTYVMGPRIKPYEMLDKPLEKIRKPELRELRDKVLSIFQEHLDESVETYGQKPFEFKRYFLLSLKNLNKIPLVSPSGWPILFMEFLRQYKKKKEQLKFKVGFGSFLKGILFNPFSLFYYIPLLGLIPLIWKGYRDNNIKELRERKRHL